MNNKRQALMLFVGALQKQAATNAQVKKIRKILKVPVQKILSPFGMLRRFFRPPMMDLSVMSGIEISSRQPMKIQFGLIRQHRPYWLNLLFEGNSQELSARRVKVKEIFQGKHLNDSSYDLTTMYIDYADFDREKQSGWFFIPEWIYGELSIPLPKKCLSQERVKSDLRRIRNNGFEYVVANGQSTYEDFYFNMHVPYIRKAHGAAAFFDEDAEQRKLGKNFDLLLIRKISQPELYVAGITIIYELGFPKLWMVGIRDGDDYVSQGVIGALYHFSFHYLVSKGFDSVGIGGSKAFLNDGVLNFKKKMFQRIVRASRNGYALKIHKLSPAVVVWLKNNPFVFKRDSALHAAVFSESEDFSSEKYFREIYKKYIQVGISSMTIYCLGIFDEKLNNLIPDELCGFVRIRPAADLLDRVRF